MQTSDAKGHERRKYRRVIFTAEHNISGQFLMPGTGHKPINALILNLSMGGLYFTPKKGRNPDIKNGDQLVFMHLYVPQSDPLILNIDAEIKWIMDPALLEHIGIGCSFIKLSSSSYQRLETFMETFLNLTQPITQ